MPDNNLIADLHCHPSAKALLGTHPDPGNRAWKTYFFKLNIIIDGIDELFGDPLDSQSSLTQVVDGRGKLIFWTLYPFEKEYVEKNEIVKLLTTAEGINTDILQLYLEKIGNNKYVRENVDYFKVLTDYELDLLDNTANIHLVAKKGATLLSTKLNIAVCIEGAHSFLSGTDKPGAVDGIDKTAYLRRMETVFKKRNIFYMTLAHITPNGIFNQAYSGKLLTQIERPKFYPRFLSPTGINILGYKVIDKCIKHSVHPDVKHLSYRARVGLYDYMEKKKKEGKKFIAPIASHMGVWGISEKQVEKAFTQGASFITYKYTENNSTHYLVGCTLQGRRHPDFSDSVYFYPKTLGLFDEDIKRIVRLGGLIGIIMDQRVLGFGSWVGSKDDIMVLEDFIWLCQRNNINHLDYLIGHSIDEVKSKAERLKKPGKVKWPKDARKKAKDDSGNPISQKKPAHIKYFCANILHTLNVIKKMRVADPWKYVCLGSDYDGLINAVDSCKTFEDIPQFKGWVQEYFEKKIPGFKRRYGIKPSDFVEHFFFKNALSFFDIRRQPQV